LFVARTGVFLFKEYSSARASGSDVELELSQVPQNTCFSKNGTWTDYVGTKGVSQNHLLNFDDNKVLKLSIGYAKHLFKVYRILIKVSFIEILIEQVKEHRDFFKA